MVLVDRCLISRVVEDRIRALYDPRDVDILGSVDDRVFSNGDVVRPVKKINRHLNAARLSKTNMLVDRAEK